MENFIMPEEVTVHTFDFEGSFVMCARTTAQDNRLSWSAKGLLFYLLSKGKTWKLNINHLSNFYIGPIAKGNGRDSIYRMIKELKDLKYIHYLKTRNEDGTWRHVYNIYAAPYNNPDFQKFIPEPDNPHMDNPPMDNPDIILKTDGVNTESYVCVDGSAEASPPPQKPPETVTKSKANGKAYQYSISDLYSATLKNRRDWKEPELEEAWRIFTTHNGPINSPFEFCEGIMKNNRKLIGFKTIKEKETKCQKKQDSKPQQKTSSEPIMAKDSLEPPLVRLNFQNGKVSCSPIG